MTRFSASENTDASSDAHVPYILFADFDFASGHARFSSADRLFTVGGNVYTPTGKLASVGEVRESAGLNSEKLEFVLSGVDTSLMAYALTEKYHGRSMTLYIGFCDHDWILVAEPEVLWEGRMDTMSIRSEANSSLISVVCENRLVIWNQASDWRYTDEHQQTISTVDTFFNLLSTLVDKIAKWGDRSVGTGYTDPGSGERPYGQTPGLF